MFDKEALEYLTGLGKTEVLSIDDRNYTTKQVFSVKDPKPAQIGTTTLSALVDYIKSEYDVKCSEKLLIHVISPTKVALLSELRDDMDRETYMQCEALTPNNIIFNKFMDTENFNIMLQSSFVVNDDRAALLIVTGTIQDKAVKEVGDDGISQAVTIKTGLATVGDAKVPNPVTLAPFRTFPEIKQPESKFIFRMSSGPVAALFEADGGAWRNEAMLFIKQYLQEELEGIDYIKVIS